MLLFLGAGASAPFGIPTMPGFIDLLDSKIGSYPIYRDIKLAYKNDYDLEVLMTILEDLSKPKDEIMESISPQTARFLFEKRKEKIEDYFDAEARDRAQNLLEEIKSIIRNECIAAARKDTKILEIYDNFFNCLQDERVKINNTKKIKGWGGVQVDQTKFIMPGPLNIFTTNYDNCVEVYFNRKQIDCCNGIISKYGEDILDVDSYNSNQTISINIFKLHGSVDLFKKQRKIRQFKSAGNLQTYLGDEIGEYSIRWPIEFGGYRHVIESPYLDLFRLLRDLAKGDKWWIIIGFSFRDRTICSILNDLLELKAQRERPTILFVDPCPEPVIKRLRKWKYTSLAKTILPIKVKFGAADFSVIFHKDLLKKWT